MRIASLLLLILFFIPLPTESFTVIFKSGKKMEGSLLWDDGVTLRFKDRSGILYSLKRSVLDISAMRDANPESIEKKENEKKSKDKTTSVMPRSLAEIAEKERLRRTGSAKLLTDGDLEKMSPLAVIETKNAAPLITSIHMVSMPGTSKELEKWITDKEKEYSRLKARCRNAGGDPNSAKQFRTDTYNVNGEDVTVTGYWADPDEVRRAQETCRNAIQTRAALDEARSKLASLNKD